MASNYKIGVVGGTGNISAAFVPCLLEAGHEVICINRGQRGHVAAGARLLRCDRHDRDEFERLVRAERFHTVIDMMAFTAEDAASTLRACVEVAHLVHCSTVCTYGVDLELPAAETHPLRPITDYGRGKAAADELLLTAWRAKQFPVTIVRPSTTYGPQMGLPRQLGADFSWLDRIRAGQPIAQLDNGACRHQFLHVRDAALCFANLVGRIELAGEVINMVREEAISWADYHHAAMAALDSEVELVGVSLKQAQTARIPNFKLCETIFRHEAWYCGTKIKSLLPEFMPSVDLVTGMTEVIAAMASDGRLPAAASEWEERLLAAAN